MSAEFVVNNKVHIVTKISPFIANYGRELKMGDDIKRRKKVKKAMEEAQKSIKKQFDKKRRNPQELKVGDHVWLENKNIHSN